ncbi:MAG: hypothetical protein M1840_009006 [Geoglossum simile]|nr:MAG: hypothetical protein M1840_009006 [Geoglossum simile]
MSKLAVLLLTTWVLRAYCLNPWNISSQSFSRMISHSTVVADDWLYIDGGMYFTTGDNQSDQQKTLNGTLLISLSKGWTNSTVPIHYVEKPSDFYPIKSPGLWWDPISKTMISFGGEPFFETPQYIWAFSPDGNGGGSWREEYGSKDPLWNTFTRPGQAMIAASPSKGYSLGGTETPPDPKAQESWAVSGMVTLDFANTTWDNITTIGAYSQNGFGFSGGGHYIPTFGRAGILVFLGGQAPPSAQPPSTPALRPMENITIFDIFHQKWYSLNATGDIPQQRMDFCITGQTWNRSDSYEIYIYGGWTGQRGLSNNPDSSNVYILSIPQFRWFRAVSFAPPRAGSSCQVIGERQMLSVGGWDPTATNFSTPADPLTYGLGVFDMMELQWTSGYNASAGAYKRPEPVNHGPVPMSWYNNSDQPELESLFFTNYTSSNYSSSSKPSRRIAGGTVGGITILIGIAAAFYFLGKRRRQRKATLETTKLMGQAETAIHPSDPSRNTVPELGPPVPELGPPVPWEMDSSQVPIPAGPDQYRGGATA